MTGHVKVSGAFKEMVSGSAVKVSGAWKDISEGHVKVSGAWKQFFIKLRVQLVGGLYRADSVSPADALCQYRLTNTGFEQADEGDGGGFSTVGTWLVVGSAADYDVRYTFTGDTGDAIGENGVWESLATTQLWSVTDTSQVGVAKEITGTIEIRDASTLEVLESKTLTLQAQESA